MKKKVGLTGKRAIAALSVGVMLGLSFGNMKPANAQAGNVITCEVLRTANVRTSPSADSDVLAVAQEGSVVSLLSEDVNGYCLISFSDVKGYIYEGCISQKDNAAQATAEKSVVFAAVEPSERTIRTGNVKTLTGLYLREEPNAVSEAILVVPAGKEVQFIDAGENGFYHVRYKGVEGYIFAKALDEERPVRSQQKEQQVPKNPVVVTNVVPESVPEVVPVPQVAEEVIPVKQEHDSLPQMQTSEDEMTLATTVTIAPSIPTGRELNGSVPTPVEFLGVAPMSFVCTAYCSCRQCCGIYSPEVTGRESHTATGTVPTQGRTIAVDPRVIPYGTHVYIEGYGEFVAEDTGGAIRGNRLDVYFASHQAAICFGRRTLNVWIMP